MSEATPRRFEGQHGWLKVDGARYEHDIIIHVDGSITERNCGCSPALRAQLTQSYLNDYFHVPLTEWELDFLPDEKPEVVIIGSGFKSMLPLTPKAKTILSGFEHKILSTPKAMEALNSEGRRYVAILHLTC